MPFNFKQYDQQCSRMSKIELRQEIERQSDTIATAGAGTGFAVLAIPLTMGISAVALGGTAPAIINAKKKRTIAKKYLETAPEGRSIVTLQPASSQTRNNRPAVWRAKAAEDDGLPAYTPVDEEAKKKAEQVYVPLDGIEADMPPSYDEATIKRMTMMGIPPPFLMNGSVNVGQSLPYTSATASGLGRSDTSVLSAGSSGLQRSTSQASSYYQEDDESLHFSSSPVHSAATLSPASPASPRTPPPDRFDAPVKLLDDEIPQQQYGKGKGRTNPFILSKDSLAPGMHF